MFDFRILSKLLNVIDPYISRVAGTMVAHSSSVQLITHSNISQLPPQLMHVGKSLPAIPDVKRLAGVAPEVDHRECTLHSPLQKDIRQNLLWL